MNRNNGLIYSNVEISPDRAYVLFVGDVKYIDTTTLLADRLARRYGKPVETINILPNMPSPYMAGKFIIINSALAEYISRDGDGKYFLPLDNINAEVSSSPYVKRVIDEILRSQSDVFINVHKNTPELTLPDGERIRAIGPSPDLFDYFDNKINQRRVAGQLEIPVPHGYAADSFDELVRLYRTHYNGDAFVMSARGFGGNGTEKISNFEDLLSSEKLRGKEKFIISELLDVESSPAALGLVANDGEILVASVSDQIMEGGVNYMGNVYPSNAGSENVERMKEYTRKLGQLMGRKWYRGFFGVDFMVDKKGNLYFAEINPRKIGHTSEVIMAYRTTMPDAVSLPELEFSAVTAGTFGTDLSGYEMPQLNWGVLCPHAEKGQQTLNYVPRERMEEDIFKDSGVTVLEHPGKDVNFLEKGKVARVVCAINGDYDSDPRQEIFARLGEAKQRIEVA